MTEEDITKIECLIGYLKAWCAPIFPPHELPGVVEEAEAWIADIKANPSGRKCETCDNEICRSDDKATDSQCGFCATVHHANANLVHRVVIPQDWPEGAGVGNSSINL